MSSVRTLAVLAFASMFGACEYADEVFQDPDEVDGYRLVAAYDASSLRALELLIPEEERPRPYEYIWREHVNMKKACGPTKAPDGLGIFEAEAIANRQMPALMLLVERRGDVPALDTSRVRVALGKEQPDIFLEPAVMPRYLQVAIEGDSATRYKQQIKTQLQTYLCMEHKTGRGWQGGTGDQVRQALLLNPPDDFRLPDRKFFGGQNEPVPALLGPPQTCIKRSDDLEISTSSGGQGGTSLALVPSDVWGASLARCSDSIHPGGTYIGPRPIDWTLSKVTEGLGKPQSRRWSQLRVFMRSEGDLPDNQFIKVTYQGIEYVDPTDEDGVGTLVPERPLFERSDSGELGLIDIVSKIPYRYPVVGDGQDDERYTLLVIPNWQLVEAIRRQETGDYGKPRPSAGVGVQDGVGWILEHPEHLYVMVPSDPQAFDHLDPSAAGMEWLNVARPMSRGLQWGYTTGMLAGRAPIALPGPVEPTWIQASTAQRATPHGIFLGAIAVLLFVFASGITRLRDLWMRVPEERVEFWPGPAEEDGGEDDAADLSGDEEESE